METVVTPQSILSSIRKRNFAGAIGYSFCVLFSLIMAFFGVYELRDNEFVLGIIAILMGAVFAVLAIGAVRKRIYLLTHIEQCRLIRKYGPLERIADSIMNEQFSTIMDHKSVLMTENFIMLRKNFESYVPYENILVMYRKEHRTNGVLDGVFLVVIDEYGDTFEYPFPLGKKHTGDVAFAANEIVKKAPRCRVGYVPENLQYAKANTKPLATAAEDSWNR